MKASPCAGNDPWETAYARFETPAQEVRKFTRRLTELGITAWSREAEILEICCGRGNGLQALSALGFSRLAGIDLSAALIAQYKGTANLYVGDCRNLPFCDRSKDIVIVQGGLHHLKTLPTDLQQTLFEAARVLKDNGAFVVVEPWLTTFLTFVHTICRIRIARHVSPKFNALATMIEYERETYDQWLSQPLTIISVFEQFFSPALCSIKWGKYMYIGRKRTSR
jgi:ubiquinone/menaquinone biosynthesis C-methylase UbiE